MIATVAVFRKIWSEVKKSSEKFFQGEITISKRECWLIGMILVLTGIAIGLVNAPLTHGVNISLCSNNGNNNGNGNCDNSDKYEASKDASEAETEPIERNDNKDNTLCKLSKLPAKKKEKTGKSKRSKRRSKR